MASTCFETKGSQEDVCTYIYGIIFLYANGISSLVGGKVCICWFILYDYITTHGAKKNIKLVDKAVCNYFHLTQYTVFVVDENS